MQVLKFVGVLALGLIVFPALAQPSLSRADSLFKTKQYMQSLDAYEAVYQQGWYSPAMLLRMAFIHEGLGHISRSLFYLQRYHAVTDDEQALQKIEELAEKNKLEGYEQTQQDAFLQVLQRYQPSVTLALAAMAVLLLSLMMFQYRQGNRPIGAALALMVIVVLLYVQVNHLAPSPKGIISDNATLLMSGPSGAADVVAVVGEGHQLTVKGRKDVWLRVEWRMKEAYVKENKLLMSSL